MSDEKKQVPFVPDNVENEPYNNCLVSIVNF